MAKKYIDIDKIKYHLNTKFNSKYYQEYKNYLDVSLELNNSFNFGKNRKKILNRQASIHSPQSESKGFVKVAFDTRYIDQETEFNPRRGLQNYSRSESFINEANQEKIELLKKLNESVLDLKSKYGKEPEWLDSYARVLCGVIEKTFNKIKKNGDFTNSQPSIGSLDYIEELLYVRYRLNFENVKDLDSTELSKIILSKDESLITKPIYQENKIVTGLETTSASGDNFLMKLFGDVRASKENPEISRTITITITDKLPGDNQAVKVLK